MSLSAQKSAQKSTQKSKPTQESAFLSKPTFLRAQKCAQKSWSAQKSAQKSAQTRGPLKKVLKRGGYSKECSKEGVAQKSGSLKRGLKKVLKKVSLLKRVSRTKDANFFWSCKYLRQCKFVCLYHLFSVVNLSFRNRSDQNVQNFGLTEELILKYYMKKIFDKYYILKASIHGTMQVSNKMTSFS